MFANLCLFLFLLGSVFQLLSSSETSLSITVLFILFFLPCMRTGWSMSIEAKSSFSFSGL